MTGSPAPHGEPSLADQISNLVVQTTAAYTGRQPVSGSTAFGKDVITVVLRDTLTRGELSLIEDGESRLVLTMRGALQRAMRTDLIAGVEEITGRRVQAFLSASNIAPDVAVETFVLHPSSAKFVIKTG